MGISKYKIIDEITDILYYQKTEYDNLVSGLQKMNKIELGCLLECLEQMVTNKENK